jgi:predicted nucleic acid-binding protein
MRIVVDANIIISALLGSKNTLALLKREDVKLYAPKMIMDEILKYRVEICDRAGYGPSDFELFYSALMSFIKTVQLKDYELYMAEANNAIGARDAKDADYIACAKTMNADLI